MPCPGTEQLVVRNQTGRDVDIFAAQRGNRVFLGAAPPGRTVFVIDGSMSPIRVPLARGNRTVNYTIECIVPARP